MLGSWHRALFIVVIVLPFLVQAFPTPGAVPVFLPVALLLLPATLLMRIADNGVPGLLLGDARFMAISALTVLTYIYGFILSIDLQYQYVFREVGNGVVAMLVSFSIANSGWTGGERAQLVRAMAWVMLCVGLFVSIPGAYKFWLFLSSAEQLDFIVEASGTDYPWGTSLVTDYNFYALTILVAILSALYLATFVGPLGQTILALLITFLVAVGTLAGSRRFWLVAPLIIGVQALWMISRGGVRRYRVVFGGLVLCLIGLPAVLYVVAGDVIELLITAVWDFQFRFLTIFDPDHVGGEASRSNQRAFGISLLEGFVVWFGSGFDYMNRFSCEFSVCGGAGYPHMPILSAFLYGGVIAAIAAGALYVYITFASFRLLSQEFEFAWLFYPLFAALLFAAISANGPLSIRSHIILGAACVGFLRAIQVESASVREAAAASAA